LPVAFNDLERGAVRRVATVAAGLALFGVVALPMVTARAALMSRAPTSSFVHLASQSVGLSGSGSETSNTFKVDSGLVLLAARCGCSRTFAVTILGPSGPAVASPIDAVGQYSGSTAFHLSAGSYRLGVVAPGSSWSVTIGQPRNMPLASQSSISFGGHGQYVLGLVTGGPELAFTVNIQSPSGGRFVLSVLTPTGLPITVPFDRAGVFTATKTVTLPGVGPYLVEVDSEATWYVGVRHTIQNAYG
jgi:hypothetical protein